MRLRRRPQSASKRVEHVRHGGADGLVMLLHGFGADERQFDTPLPLDLPIVQVTPRAPERVDPGFGWWLPEHRSDGLVELAPVEGVASAVDRVVSSIRSRQEEYAIGAERTLLVGYSQGATLALIVAAAHPDAMVGTVAVAGHLPSDEPVQPPPPGRSVLLLNGWLDPLISTEDHYRTATRFSHAGYEVVERRDRVPHVIDEAQVPDIERFIAARLGRPARSAMV